MTLATTTGTPAYGRSDRLCDRRARATNDRADVIASGHASVSLRDSRPGRLNWAIGTDTAVWDHSNAFIRVGYLWASGLRGSTFFVTDRLIRDLHDAFACDRQKPKTTEGLSWLIGEAQIGVGWP